jgi:hypothetical protein
MKIERSPTGASLIDVLDRVLDKGIVIDAWVRLSLVGIDLVTLQFSGPLGVSGVFTSAASAGRPLPVARRLVPAAGSPNGAVSAPASPRRNGRTS